MPPPGTSTWILSKRASCGHGNFWNIWLGPAYITVKIDDGMGNYYILNSNVSVSDGQWHVVTLARIGTATQLSIDGITQKIVEQASAANLTNSARLLAGTADARVCGGIEAPFVGKIDNVQVISGQ